MLLKIENCLMLFNIKYIQKLLGDLLSVFFLQITTLFVHVALLSPSQLEISLKKVEKPYKVEFELL